MIRRPLRTARVAVGVLAPAVATLALLPLRTDVVNVNLALVLVLVVLAVGAGAGRVAGLVAAGTAALSYDALLTRPYGSLRIHEGEDVVTTALLGLVGVTAALLTERVRRHAEAAAHDRRALQRLERSSELVSGARSRNRVLTVATRELTALLDLKVCRFEPAPTPADAPRLEHGVVTIPAPGDASPRLALPVRHHGRELGHFVLVFPRASIGLDLAPDQRRAATTLADTVGAALQGRS